jgi:hypothetical protein
MVANPNALRETDPHAYHFYRAALRTVRRARLPFLVGGAYALGYYTGVVRHTKDFDLFVRPADAPRVLEALAEAGYRTEMTFPHWLGKAFAQDDFVDVIFCSGNGLCPVDDDWFAHATPARVLGLSVKLCPAEEMIWQKAFIMERERFDGADVNHLLWARGPTLDWRRLLGRFGPHWRILLSHLLLFGYVYPAERHKVPAEVLGKLLEGLRAEMAAGGNAEDVCRGPMLSRGQYLVDTEAWGYRDARLPPSGTMTPEQITHWTAAIDH